MANTPLGTEQILNAAKEMSIKDIVPDFTSLGKPGGTVNFIPPRILDPSFKYYSKPRTRGRGTLVAQEYDLSEIGRIEDIDSYVRQSFDKKVALMFKEGLDIVGGDERTSAYITQRFNQIAHASQQPILLLFRQLGSSLVRKQNAFLLKVRKEEASGGKSYIDRDGKKIIPIAALFSLPAETMMPIIKENRIAAWRQRLPSGESKDYKIEDIVHIHYQKKDGFAIATPSIIPVIDDIRTLRKIEEDIEFLIYQHLFPMFQWKVGTKDSPAGIDEKTGEREVDLMRSYIETIPSEGGIVTTERHEIKAIGAEGRALRIDGYLEHFKMRVLAGLGVSSVDMGDGQTANRATADNMSRNLIDAVKDFQQVFELFINHYLIEELLLESTFDPSAYRGNNKPVLVFKEVDIEAQRKIENHAADLFNKNVLGMNEVRKRVGVEPMRIPTYSEIRKEMDTVEAYPIWNELHFRMFDLPQFLIQSLDEPWSSEAKQSLETRTKTEKESKTSSSGQSSSAKTSNAQMNDGIVSDSLSDLLNFFSQSEAMYGSPTFARGIVETQFRVTMKPLLLDQLDSFRRGYGSVSRLDTMDYIRSTKAIRGILRDRSEKYLLRLSKDMGDNVYSFLSRQDKAQPSQDLETLIKSYQYRGSFIEDVEIKKAYMIGVVMGHKNNRGEEIELYAQEDACDQCKLVAKTYNLKDLTISDMPPHHPNCTCSLRVVLKKGTEVLAEQDNYANTKERFSLESPLVSKKLLRIQNSLRKKYPNWGDEKITKLSEKALKRIGVCINEK